MSDLTKQVAEFYNVPESRKIFTPVNTKVEYNVGEFNVTRLPLNQDIETLMKLAIENMLIVGAGQKDVSTHIVGSPLWIFNETYAEHNNDKLRATCYAIMRALVAIKG